jgi:tRNA threonylcarbamoyladenosine biosynthesis protein TsaE
LESGAVNVLDGQSEAERATPGAVVQRLTAVDAAATRTIGLHLAERLRPGDLVILSGELGAGKTTFTQGLAEGLGVRGPITSPTFVLARVHPSLVGGPALVHVDAYRLGSLAELDDLDLDTSIDDSVTVVEWGEGKAEVLAEGRSGHYVVRLDRSRDDDVREITISRAA